MKLPSVFLVAATASLGSALQFCKIDLDHSTDLCLAVSSATNTSTGQDDLSIQFSAKFEEENGWAAVGFGEEMSGALMFVMYPGVKVDDTTFNMRTIDRHASPLALESSSITPVTSVSRLWYDPLAKIHHAQFTCYSCESWTTSSVSVTNSAQPLIWASNMYQKTRSASTSLALQMHRARGVVYLNMLASFTAGELVPAQVSEERVSTPGDVLDLVMGDHDHAKGGETTAPKHHHHKTFGIVAIHGMLLVASYLALSIGTLFIRSGLAKSFKSHWIIQVAGGVGIVVGCLVGIYISYSHNSQFATYHQWIGLTILPTILLQALFGYLHHVNFVRYHSRTVVSHYHVWIGRLLLVGGNANVYLGLSLSHAGGMKRVVYCAVIAVQAVALVSMWWIWARGGRTIRDVVGGKAGSGRGGVQYRGVDGGEGDAFIVGEIGDGYELDGEEGRAVLGKSGEGEDGKKTDEMR